MKKRSKEDRRWDELHDRIIGLGERSLRKSYYPELQQKLREFEQINRELEAELERNTQRQTLRELLREAEEKKG